MPATPAQVRRAIENYVKAWATGDKELFLSLFAPDAQWWDPVGTPPFKGVLKHAGWRATSVNLPKRSGQDPQVIAPAEVEIS